MVSVAVTLSFCCAKSLSIWSLNINSSSSGSGEAFKSIVLITPHREKHLTMQIAEILEELFSWYYSDEAELLDHSTSKMNWHKLDSVKCQHIYIKSQKKKKKIQLPIHYACACLLLCF